MFYYAAQKFGFWKSMSSVKGAKPENLLFALFLIIMAYAVRGRRWMIWEKKLEYFESLKLILIGFMGNNVFPARRGELIRARCAEEKIQRDPGKVQALASVAGERIIDGLVLSTMGILGLRLVRLENHLFLLLLLTCILFISITLVLVLSIHFHQKAREVLDSTNRFFPGHLTKLAKEKANYFLDGLLSFEKTERLGKVLSITIVIWSIELLFYYTIANSVFNVSIYTCLIFVSVVNFSSLFPFTAAGIGVIEIVATTFLVSSGIPPHEAFAMVILQHTYQFAFTTITGAFFYITGNYKITKQEKSEPKTDSKKVLISQTREKIDTLAKDMGLEPGFNKKHFLSIVIPAYNEQNRLPKTVLETIRWCNTNNMDYELIIADDGSSDDTLFISELFMEQDKNIRVVACPHMGKGATVRMGMLNARGKYVLFMDADGATPLSEIPKLIKELESGYDIAIGSRVIQNPGEVNVQTSLHRKIIGRTFALFVNIFAISGIADTQCGFKLFSQRAVKEVFSRQKTHGFAFDVEILFIANRLSFSISEIPVNWTGQAGSKVNIITDSFKMFLDITRVRWLHREEDWSKTIAKYK